MTNYTLPELAQYQPEALQDLDLPALLKELEAWRKLAEDKDVDSPDEAKALIESLEGNQCNNHEDYDDLKEFFEDCVGSLDKDWPCAEAYDQNLRQVIMAAISRGEALDDEDE